MKARAAPNTVLPIKTLEALKTMQAGDSKSQSVTRRLPGDTHHVLSNLDISNPYRSTIH